MKSENGEPGYLKMDSQGRVRTPAGKREAILDAFERSGMSGKAFAEHVGVKYQTFATWVQKRNRKRSQEDPGQGHSDAGADAGRGVAQSPVRAKPRSKPRPMSKPLALLEAVVEPERPGPEQRKRLAGCRLTGVGGVVLS
jgi:hypothetical protein